MHLYILGNVLYVWTLEWSAKIMSGPRSQLNPTGLWSRRKHTIVFWRGRAQKHGSTLIMTFFTECRALTGRGSWQMLRMVLSHWMWVLSLTFLLSFFFKVLNAYIFFGLSNCTHVGVMISAFIDTVLWWKSYGTIRHMPGTYFATLQLPSWGNFVSSSWSSWTVKCSKVEDVLAWCWWAALPSLLQKLWNFKNVFRFGHTLRV